jgi:regulator of protease activity HflC (stomatin/prohibitin superfamily)
MFWFIVGIILVLIGFGAFLYCYNYSEQRYKTDENDNYVYDANRNRVRETYHPSRKYSAIVLIVLLIFGALSIFGSCVKTVPTGHTGVATVFGKVQNYTLDAGMNFTSPWVKVIKMDNRVQKATIDLACFSSDIQEVNIKYTLNYQINKENAMNIYKSVGVNYYDNVIAPNVIEAVKEVTALYTAEQLVNCRAELAAKIESILAERLLERDIVVVNTAIEDMDFTDAFTNAVEAKQVAQQNKLKAETVAAQKVVEAEAAAKIKTVEAEAKAEADKIAADAEAYQIEVKATAEAEANKKIAESVTNTLIDYEYAQAWDGKLPTYMSGDGSFVPVMNMN